MTQPVAETTHTVQRAGFANPLTLEILVTDEDYIQVYVDDVQLDASEYSVAGIGDVNGIEITITDGEDVDFYPDALTITAVFDPPISQPDDLSAGGLFGLAYENAVDKIVRIIQSIAGKLDRTLKVPYGIEGDMTLPTPLPGAIIAWNDDGDGFQNGPNVDELSSLTGSAAARALVYPAAPEDPVYDAGGRKIGDVADGTAPTDVAAFGQIAAAIVAFAATLGTLATKSAVAIADMTAAALLDLRRVGPGLGAPLEPIYWSATSIAVPRMTEGIAMCGAFHQGRWKKPTGRIFAPPAVGAQPMLDIISAGNATSTQGALLFESFGRPDSWLNLFAYANDADTTFQYGLTPSLRVGALAGSVVTLNIDGENSYPSPPSAKTRQWADDALIGVSVLVVTEGIGSRINGWSGRVTTITDNTNAALTLADVGTIGVGDYLILLPNADHYVWLCDAYLENNGGGSWEVRNIGTQGAAERQATMQNLTWNFPAAGVSVAGPPGQRMDIAGSVSPLARSALVDSTITMNTGSLGNYAETYDQDGAHPTDGHYMEKIDATAATYVTRVTIGGSYGPWFYFKNSGSFALVTSHSLQVRGWKY